MIEASIRPPSTPQPSGACSKDVKSAEILKLLGEEYRMVQLFVNPADVGHGGIARRRTYIFYYNWMRVDYCFDVFDIYQKISREILKLGTTQPRDYLITDHLGKCADEMNMARKRQRVYAPVICLYFIMPMFFFQPFGVSDVIFAGN